MDQKKKVNNNPSIVLKKQKISILFKQNGNNHRSPELEGMWRNPSIIYIKNSFHTVKKIYIIIRKHRAPELEGMWRNPSILKGGNPDSSGATTRKPELIYYYY
jgi:hypothetical protein